MTTAQLQEFLNQAFTDHNLTVLHADESGARLRLQVNESHLRPGGTISGPAMMGLADAAMYMALLTRIGLVALAVTTNFNINFLRKPTGNLEAEARLLKLGKRLAVGEISIYSEGHDDVVAHATCTYSIPQGNRV